MRKKLKPIFAALLIMLLAAIFSCTEDDTDPCDATVKPEIQVNIRATVHVLDKDNNPIAGQQVNFWIYKEPCGAAIKGNFDFSGTTNTSGILESGLAGYNLRNSEDKVWVDAHAVNLGNGSADADSELISYKYGEFTVGTTKHVDVYIYRNF